MPCVIWKDLAPYSEPRNTCSMRTYDELITANYVSIHLSTDCRLMFHHIRLSMYEPALGEHCVGVADTKTHNPRQVRWAIRGPGVWRISGVACERAVEITLKLSQIREVNPGTRGNSPGMCLVAGDVLICTVSVD